MVRGKIEERRTGGKGGGGGKGGLQALYQKSGVLRKKHVWGKQETTVASC